MSKAKKAMLRSQQPWTEEEIRILQDCWGTISVYKIAKKLKRSIRAVEAKATKLKLGLPKDSSGMITATDLAEVTGVSIQTVTQSWVTNYGLKCHYKVIRKKRKYYLIDINDFWEWAYHNQDKFNSQNMELNILGKEPPWMAEKRKKDSQEKMETPKKKRPWTTKEEYLLLNLAEAGYSLNEIASKLKRSRASVEQKYYRLKNKLVRREHAN